MADANIGIAIRAKNEASGTLRQVKADVQGINNAASAVAGGLSASLLGGLAVGGAVVAGVAGVTAAVGEMVQTTDQLNRLRGSFNELAQGAGQSAEAMLQAMRSASGGMISDADLILSANKAMLLGVADSGEELAALLKVAQARGKAMGLSATQAFNDIVTGLGRESALILDNLGIAVDLTAVMDDYARSLGVAAKQLDGAQRKQALLNEVMRQSANIKPATPTGPGTAAAQAAVAQQQAAAAIGEFFSVPTREWAQIQADALNSLAGRYDEFAVAVREVNDALADQESGRTNMPEEYADRLRAWAEGMSLVAAAASAGLPEAEAYLDTLMQMSVSGLSGGFSQQDINIMQLATAAIRGATAEREKAAAAAQRAAAHYIEEATAQQHAAQMAYQASAAYQENVRQHEALVAVAWRASAEMQAMAAQFGVVGAVALQAATDINTFNAAVGRIQAGFAAADRVQGLRQSAIAAAESNAQRAVEAGADPRQVAAQLAEVTDQIWNMAGPTEQTTEGMFLFRQATDAAGSSLESTADSLETANRAASRMASGGMGAATAAAKAATQAYDNLQSKALSAVQAASSLDPVGVDPADFLPREDAVQENAFRLAAIMNEGLADQPWLEEFKREVPAVFAELAASGDVRGTAAKILQQFQAGLRPELLDMGALKDKIRNDLISESAMQMTAKQITAELVMETGGDAGDIQRQVEQALGLVDSQVAVDVVLNPPDTTALTGLIAPPVTGDVTFAPDFSALAGLAPELSGVVRFSADLTAIEVSGPVQVSVQPDFAGFTAATLPDLPGVAVAVVPDTSLFADIALPDVPGVSVAMVPDLTAFVDVALPDVPGVSVAVLPDLALWSGLTVPPPPPVATAVVPDISAWAEFSPPDVPGVSVAVLPDLAAWDGFSVPDVPGVSVAVLPDLAAWDGFSVPDVPGVRTAIVPDVSAWDGFSVPDVPGVSVAVLPDLAAWDGFSVPDVPGVSVAVLPDLAAWDGFSVPDVPGVSVAVLPDLAAWQDLALPVPQPIMVGVDLLAGPLEVSPAIVPVIFMTEPLAVTPPAPVSVGLDWLIATPEMPTIESPTVGVNWIISLPEMPELRPITVNVDLDATALRAFTPPPLPPAVVTVEPDTDALEGLTLPQLPAVTVAVLPDMAAMEAIEWPALAAIAVPIVPDMAAMDTEMLRQNGVMAGGEWGAGFAISTSGTIIVAAILVTIAREFPRFRDSGAAAGSQWGAGFMVTVESGIAAPLISLLATLVTPGVLANLRAAATQTTPP